MTDDIDLITKEAWYLPSSAILHSRHLLSFNLQSETLYSMYGLGDRV